jgi:acetyl esterase/lipase
MDDTVFLARRTSTAGIDTTCHIWPMLPHAFPLFASIFPEALAARDDIANFIGQHLARAR